jgi:hypothetical protein
MLPREENPLALKVPAQVGGGPGLQVMGGVDGAEM